MKNTLLIGVLATLATGAAIGLQATLNARIGSVITPVRTGLWMNFIGGAIAGVFIFLFVLREGSADWRLTPSVVLPLIVAGALGILVITGVSFSLARTGVAAGLAGMFLGQMLIGLIVDTFGWGITEPIPVSGTRVAGLLLMALAVYLLLPRG